MVSNTNNQQRKATVSALLFITLCASSLVVVRSQSQTINDIIQNGKCDSSSAASGLSNQIITLSQKMFACYFSDIDGIAELDGKSPIPITKILEKNTAVEIEKLFQNKNQKLSLTYGLVGLPEFYIFNAMYKKNSACATLDFMNILGTSYSDCKLCHGNYFFTSSADQLLAIKDNIMVFSVKDYKLVTVSSSADFKKLFVESFQLMWNCNNPTDTIQVTGNFDIQTEQKFVLAPADGFQNVCMKCEVQNCGQCTADFKSCKSCKTGYTMNPDGTCTNCSDNNCLECTKNSNGTDVCNKCSSGYHLLDGTCKDKCPSDYTQTATHCLKCRSGTYGSGSQCIDCSKYCKSCSGPLVTDCSACFDGFIMNINEGCKPCANGQCCGTVKCADDEFRNTDYPYECKKCGNNCATCSGPDPKQCLSCKNGYNFENGFCNNPSQQLNTYLDANKQQKPCHFSCQECVDSSNLCTVCKNESNFYIEVDTKMQCFQKCPSGYEPFNGDVSSTDFVKCVIKQSLSDSDIKTLQLIQDAKNKCVSSQFWDVDQKKCVNCASNCLSCTDDDNCDSCASGLYWNSTNYTCSPCHSSCSECSGPTHKDCVKCKNINSLFSNNGVCDSMASTPSSTITVSQDNLFKDLTKQSNLFDSNAEYYKIRLGVSQFTTQNSIWDKTELLDAALCTFSNFKEYYTSLKNPSISCQDSQLNRATMSNKGAMTAIYAMILAQSGVTLEGKGVNPASLAKYAKTNNLYSSFYGYIAQDEFACNQLSCESSLNSYLSNLPAQNNLNVSIKQQREIPLTFNNANIDCFAANGLVDESKVQEIDLTVTYANQSLKTSYKQYFILEVCGRDSTSKSMIQKQYLVNQYFGNGFFETVGAHLPEGQQTQSFYVGGASKEQNDYSKKNNSKYVNNFESYKVLKVRVIQVEELDASVDKTSKSYSQVVKNAKLTNNVPSKCNCISNTADFVIANDDNNNELILIVTPLNNFLSKEIDAFSIKHITSLFNLDLDKMKQNNTPISSTMGKQIFFKVIQESTDETIKCYGLDKSINQCLQNVLIDLTFSNRLKCVNPTEFSAFIAKSNYQGLVNSLQSSQWCQVNSDRCAKNLQIIKGCL